MMRPVQNTIDTVNAAAAAIVTAERRTQPPTELRRKWADRLSVFFCFGSQMNGWRINHATLVPEPAPQRTDAPAAEIPNHPPPPVFPFVAPPSSPASFIQSETTSTAQSPRIDAPLFSLLSPNSTSPTRPHSIFAIGPYTHETELVSPPVFSAVTTESSTAAFTPPESVHQTTPSSPEVPYAKLVTSIYNSNSGETGDLKSYPNHPDSPIEHLISPSSGFSGSSSPFSTKILDGEGVATQKLIPCHMRNGGSLLDAHITAAVTVADFSARLQHKDRAMDHHVSFELTAQDVARRLEKKTAISGDSATASFHLAPTSSGDYKRESLSIRLAKEFNFNNVDATNVEPSVVSDWWANEKVADITEEP